MQEGICVGLSTHVPGQSNFQKVQEKGMTRWDVHFVLCDVFVEKIPFKYQI